MLSLEGEPTLEPLIQTPSFGESRPAVSPDGERFLMIKPAADDTSTPTQIIFVENWLEELKRLVPVP